jgi:hypothetical protein
MDLIKRAFTTNLKDVSFTRVIRALKKRWLDIPHTISWVYSNESKKNSEKIKKYKNKHKGQRCFIVANGPSLKKTNLSLLKSEFTIGMNRISLMEKINGFKPTYLVVADIEIQLMQFTDEYNRIQIPKFFPWEVRDLFSKTRNTFFYKMKFANEFCANFEGFVGAGKSVTVICIQLAYYMGFDEVILIGKDHSYSHSQKGVPGKRLRSNGKEDNHFIKNYYSKGMKWSIPNYLEEEESYEKAKIAFENDGRKIFDATIGGKLNVFNKVNYNDLF